MMMKMIKRLIDRIKGNKQVQSELKKTVRPFAEYCLHCGYELKIDKDHKFGYVTKWCAGRCADGWND